MQIKLLGGDIIAQIPSPSGGEQSVTIPLTLEGLRILKRILSAEPHREFGTRLGTPAEPTQALVNAWLRSERQRTLATEVSDVEDLELEIEI